MGMWHGMRMLRMYVHGVACVWYARRTHTSYTHGTSMQAPPWLLIGMEGFFGTILSVCVVYPLAIYLPGADHGSIESLSNTITMLNNNPVLLQLSIFFCITVFILNSFSVLVTFMLSSVWHAILDNFRPITIWATQLVIYSLSGGTHGESWSRGSYLQVSTVGEYVRTYT